MSNKTPPQSEHVNPIKEDLYELIRNNEFKREKKLFFFFFFYNDDIQNIDN